MSDELTKIIVFNMHNQYFAFEISDITDVSRLKEITRVPNTPAFVKGVINLRGKVVLLISLSLSLSFNLANLGIGFYFVKDRPDGIRLRTC